MQCHVMPGHAREPGSLVGKRESKSPEGDPKRIIRSREVFVEVIDEK